MPTPDQVQRLLAPGGMVDRFVGARAAQMLDMTDTPGAGSPRHGSRAEPGSAVFLQRATEIGTGLFPNGRPGQRSHFRRWPNEGRAFVRLGGTGGPVEAATDSLITGLARHRSAGRDRVVFNTGAGEARLAQLATGASRLLAPLRLATATTASASSSTSRPKGRGCSGNRGRHAAEPDRPAQADAGLHLPASALAACRKPSAVRRGR